jgi:hypothetical protein
MGEHFVYPSLINNRQVNQIKENDYLANKNKQIILRYT